MERANTAAQERRVKSSYSLVSQPGNSKDSCFWFDDQREEMGRKLADYFPKPIFSGSFLTPLKADNIGHPRLRAGLVQVRLIR